MEFMTNDSFVRLSNPGVTSEQLLSPHNSSSVRVTITRVTVQPGVSQPRHRHDAAEQVWVALSGSGQLLLHDDATKAFAVGDIARFADGDVHGLANVGSEPFVYMAVTSPPINFDYAYKRRG